MAINGKKVSAKGKGKMPMAKTAGSKSAKKSTKTHKKHVPGGKMRVREPVKVESSSSESEKEISVDFEFFNMSEGDFHTVKQFLSVAFGTAGHSLSLSNLSTFITEDLADHVGTTAKSEGEQSDPLAFCTCIPFSFHAEKSKDLVDFLLSKCEGNDEMTKALHDNCALIINERFMNLPAGVAGPMLENLRNDWENGIKEDATLKAEHVLVMTPTFTLVKSQLDEELGVADQEKAAQEFDDKEQFYYQEAEFLDQFAVTSVSFKVATSHTSTDSRRAFTENGIDAARRIFLLTRAKFAEYVRLVNEKLID